MKITANNVEVSVRRDLTPSKLLKCLRINMTDVKSDMWGIKQSLGGHYLEFSGKIWEVNELSQVLVPKAKKVCLDYTVESSNIPFYPASGRMSFLREITSARMAVVSPEDDWDWKEVIDFMKENGLRPATFYEHVCFVGTNPEIFTHKTAVPFGGYNGPKRYTCSGLALISDGEFDWSEGGAGFTKGKKESAKHVAFTATHIT